MDHRNPGTRRPQFVCQGVCLSPAFSRVIRPLRGALSLLKNKPVMVRL